MAQPSQSQSATVHFKPAKVETRNGLSIFLGRRFKRLAALPWPLLDVALILAASALAWYLRYEVQLFRVVESIFYNPLSEYYGLFALLAATILFVLSVNGAYTPRRGGALIPELVRIFNAALAGIVVVVAVTFGVRPLAYSRLLFFYDGVLIVLFLGLARAIRRAVEVQLRQRGLGVQKVLIVGAGEIGRAVMRTMAARPDLGYHVVGFVDDDPARGTTDLGRFHALGGLEALETQLTAERVDEVIITLPWLYQRKITGLINVCQRLGARPRIVPDLLQPSLNQVDVDDLGGIPLIGIKEYSLSRAGLVVKRLLDITVSALGLFLFSPLWGLVALLIKLESHGPILFRQTRIGQGGKPFTVYKFRTMRDGAEEHLASLADQNQATGPLFKIKDDPRLTRLGRLFRRTSIDEVPQLFNILRGEMSLVGPRPALPGEVEKYESWQRQRLEAPQGLTGLPQVSGRSDLTFDETCLLDIYYIENWSLSLDLTIMLRTIPQVIFGKGAY
jgi:exopolysaccharide biosynthesis polyprenyl glycosylphosphotransferase